MSRIVRCSLIQATNAAPPDASLEATKSAMIEKHVAYIKQAADAGARIACLQEIFYGPYFCAEQTTKWYDFTEPVPDGPTIRLMRDLAKQLHVALVVPVYEVEQEGIYYNRGQPFVFAELGENLVGYGDGQLQRFQRSRHHSFVRGIEIRKEETNSNRLGTQSLELTFQPCD